MEKVFLLEIVRDRNEEGNITKYARRSLCAQLYYILINVPFTNINKIK